MTHIDNALRTLDDAVTKVRRVEREAQQEGDDELVQKMRRVRRELDDVEEELKRVKRDLRRST